jgi:hydrogenase nickel incorporation protein HypA/HybF
MHEMALAESVLELAEAAARRENARQIKLVVLEIGQLAAVEPEALRFCFEAVTRDSLAQGAVLEIISLPGTGWCAACAASVPIAALHDVCPRCGGYDVQATGGMAMRVREIGIE